jgi:hypothetical protein
MDLFIKLESLNQGTSLGLEEEVSRQIKVNPLYDRAASRHG